MCILTMMVITERDRAAEVIGQPPSAEYALSVDCEFPSAERHRTASSARDTAAEDPRQRADHNEGGSTCVPSQSIGRAP